MNNFQSMFDFASNMARDTRKRYHLTLGRLIKVLEATNPDVNFGAVDPDGTPIYLNGFTSYRGYYADLAIKPSSTPTKVGTILLQAKAALGKTFKGYKGGDFEMGDDTPLWVAPWGSTGHAVVDIAINHESIRLILKEVD